MDQIRTLVSRIASLFRRRQLDAALEEELAVHIELATEENLAQGMNRSQARTAALRSFGGVTQITETYRQRQGFPLLEQIWRDVRFGLRQLNRSPGFTVTAVLTLALGLGANTAIFSLVNALLLRPLPVPHSEQLTALGSEESDFDAVNDGFSAPMFRALEKRHEAFQEVAAYSNPLLQVRGTSGNQQVSGALVSGQFFAAMETAPLLGRYLSPEDDRAGSPNGFACVISEGFWRNWFGSAPNVAGSKLVIANVPFTVVGVMPQTFIGADPIKRPQIYVPLSAEPITDAPYDMISAGEDAVWLRIIARRKPGVSLEQANAAIHAATHSVVEESVHDTHRLDNMRTNHFQLKAESGSEGETYLRSQFRKPLVVVFSLCAGVLVLACLNLASLLMARATARERELATRLAIGASRGRLLQQLLIESLLIASLGTIAGLSLAPLVSRSLAALLVGNDTTAVLDTSLDWRAILFAVVVTLLTGLLIGLVPALRATSIDLNQQIKSGSHSNSARDRHRLLPQLLMGLEVALALMLVIGAGLLATSLMRLYRTGLGFEPKNLVNLDINMGKQGLEGDALLRWYQEFGDALTRQPGVKGASFDSSSPLSGSMSINGLHTPADKSERDIWANTVSPDYFDTMRIPILSGRDFRWTDTLATGKKIILNSAAAKVLFPGRNPIGQTVLGYKEQALEVIAVVGDTTYESIRKPAPPQAYWPITQSDEKKPSYSALVRMEGPAAPFASAVRSLANRMAPDIPAPVMTTMSSALDDSISSERMMALLSVFFAACALLVTSIGLYGTLAYATARRTSEIGIRMALGAQRLQVVAMVFRENTWVAASGCLIGLFAAVLASKALTSFLYGTSTHDPWVLTGSVLALALIASAASLLPAIRAARIDPMEALRTE